MNCPRCDQTGVDTPACPRCGVIFAKLRTARPRPEPAPSASPPKPAPSTPSGYGGLVAPLLFLVIGMLGAFWYQRRTPPAPPPAAPRLRVAPAPRGSQAEIPLPTAGAALAPLLRDPPLAPQDPDVQIARSLVARVNTRPPSTTGADLQTAEELHARRPDEPGLTRLLRAVLLAAAGKEQSGRRYAEAAVHLRRAASLEPTDIGLRLATVEVLMAGEDWRGAEAAAREVLALDARSVEALEALAFALFRQDRNREASDVLHSVLEIRESAQARLLLARIEKGMSFEKGMTEQRLSHFNVRYDGESHDDVGREILRALEHHFATLTRSMDFEPQATIPVILLSREVYYRAAGAPAWSGGAYDPMDGRIRIPIGGLTFALTADMDDTLIHELTHAFIAERSRGLAPREIHEGLAQYMEGKRLASLLTPDQLKTLADGRARGVGGFYLQALSLVEYLMAIRGQGGINDVLRQMGETGDIAEAFRRTYGQDYAATQRAWADRVHQLYGS